MALIGTGFHQIGLAVFNPGSNLWGDFTSNEYQFFAGQGFDLPLGESWINKPTGTVEAGGIVMGFPRSAEAIDVEIIVSGEGWQVREC